MLFDPDNSTRAAAIVRQAVEELGLTYGGGDQPWPFDPIPLVLDHPSWARLEQGLAQRARLFDRLLQDLYGPRRVVEEGLLPPALVFDNTGFLRPCSGIAPRGGWLTLYAADLVQLGDGGWAVLADRTQAPSGLGYTLANRALSQRVAPDLIEALRPAPVAPAADMLAAGLARLSPRPQRFGVVLTPGPYSETYAEHALLARGLGWPLVKGEELRVAGGAVHLDALGGQRRVDAILRRIDDVFADPLVLRADSLLGVAGLVAAARDGTIAIGNALGAGAVEAPGMLPYLPRLAQALLGETLLLPSVETIWLGDAAALARWRQAPAQWVVKGAFAGGEPHFSGDPDVARLVAAAPCRFAAQRLVAPARRPVLGETGSGRPIVLRGYAIAGEGEAWHIVPGGLVRFGHAFGPPIVSMQQGGGAKDCWVLSDPSVTRAPVGAQKDPASVREPRFRRNDQSIRPQPMPRRLADNLFWLGRYLARAAAEAGRVDGDPAASLAQLRRIARELRDRLDPAAWRSLDRLFAAAGREASPAAAAATAAIGDAAAAMPEGVFVAAGQRIEHGLQTIAELQAAKAAPAGLALDAAQTGFLASQLRALAALFAQFPGAPDWAADARQQLEDRLSSLLGIDPRGEHSQVDRALRECAQTLAAVSDLLTRACFAPSRQAA